MHSLVLQSIGETSMLHRWLHIGTYSHWYLLITSRSPPLFAGGRLIVFAYLNEKSTSGKVTIRAKAIDQDVEVVYKLSYVTILAKFGSKCRERI